MKKARSAFKPAGGRWRVPGSGLSLLVGLPIFLKRMIVISLEHKEKTTGIVQNNYTKIDSRLANL